MSTESAYLFLIALADSYLEINSDGISVNTFTPNGHGYDDDK